jgi:hypothetical protein
LKVLSDNIKTEAPLSKAMKSQILPAILVAASLVLLFLPSCRKDNFSSDPGLKLSFSTDTVLFDTVFTTVGSATRILKVYNPNNQDVRISRVFIPTGGQSKYRMNVDGASGYFHSDIELRAKDSLFIFLEVTLDPNNASTPLIVEENIVFETNGNIQEVTLAAWGRDAYFYGGVNGFYVLPCQSIWNNDKPHVVYGIVAVGQDCLLQINEGTEVYVHSKSGIYVYRGTLEVNGTLGNEVRFLGDRLESAYRDLPGQWGIQLSIPIDDTDFGSPIATLVRGGIWLFGSKQSTINYAILRNGGIGIQADTVYTAGMRALTINNTIIENMSGIGLLAQGSIVNGYNNVIANCGEACMALLVGGEYNFDYTTVANYWTRSSRQTPAFVLSNNYQAFNGSLIVRPLTNTKFRNCIFYGNNASINNFSEWLIDIQSEGDQDYQFQYCLVDTDLDVSDNNPRFLSMVKNQAPNFRNPSIADFRLKSEGGSLMEGLPLSEPVLDLAGNPRFSGNQTEKGAYEFVP